MPKEILTTVYTFEELLARGDQKAIERAKAWLSEVATMHDWFDYAVETWQSALDQIGFENAKIGFTGFGSQGDGASFTADVNIEKLANFLSTEIQPHQSIGANEDGKEDFRPWVVYHCRPRVDTRLRRIEWVHNHLYMKVEQISSQYSHEMTCRVVSDFYDNGKWMAGLGWQSRTPRVAKLVDEFVLAAEELRLNLSKAIYRYLEEEYEYLQSDKSLKELADDHEYTFTSAGEQFG